MYKESCVCDRYTIQKVQEYRERMLKQNIDRQKLSLIDMNKIFIDYSSRKDTDRKQLTELLEYIREGDELYLHSMDRLARNLDNLRSIVTNHITQGITIEFIK